MVGSIGQGIAEIIFLYILPFLGASIRWIVLRCIGRKTTFQNLWENSKTNLLIGSALFIMICFIVIMNVN